MIGERIRTMQGMEGARRATGIPCMAATAQGARSMQSLSADSLPDPEVPEKAVRRRFTTEYKVNILRQADQCRSAGDIGALLRREGLYSSHLTTWRRQREAGILSGLQPKPRGRKPNPHHPLQDENVRLRKENVRLQKRLKKAELIIDIQKKISQMLGIPLKNHEPGEDD
jgi:transposase